MKRAGEDPGRLAARLLPDPLAPESEPLRWEGGRHLGRPEGVSLPCQPETGPQGDSAACHRTTGTHRTTLEARPPTFRPAMSDPSTALHCPMRPIPDGTTR